MFASDYKLIYQVDNKKTIDDVESFLDGLDASLDIENELLKLAISKSDYVAIDDYFNSVPIVYSHIAYCIYKHDLHLLEIVMKYYRHVSDDYYKSREVGIYYKTSSKMTNLLYYCIRHENLEAFIFLFKNNKSLLTNYCLTMAIKHNLLEFIKYIMGILPTTPSYTIDYIKRDIFNIAYFIRDAAILETIKMVGVHPNDSIVLPSLDIEFTKIIAELFNYKPSGNIVFTIVTNNYNSEHTLEYFDMLFNYLEYIKSIDDGSFDWKPTAFGHGRLFSITFATKNHRIIEKAKEYGAILDSQLVFASLDINLTKYIRNLYGNLNYERAICHTFCYSDYRGTSIIRLFNYIDYLYSIKNSIVPITEDYYRKRLFCNAILYNDIDIHLLKKAKDYGAIVDERLLIRLRNPLIVDMVKDVFGYIYTDRTLYYLAEEKDIYYIENYQQSISEFISYLRQTNTNNSLIYNAEIIQLAVNNKNMFLIQFLIELMGTKIDLYIYNIHLGCKRNMALMLLEKVTPELSPLLDVSMSRMLKFGVNKLTPHIDFDLPGFRPIIYMDISKMHGPLREKALLYRKYLEDRNNTIVECLEKYLCKDVVRYIICKYV